MAASFDPIYDEEGWYYVNTQLGEDLVTNPEAHSAPEEVLLHNYKASIVLATSNLVPRGEMLLSETQRHQLRSHLEVIHKEFTELYDPEPGEPFAMEIEFKITSANVLSIKQARPWVFYDAPPPSSNNLATGEPTISGTAQVDAALTAGTSGIADADGLENSTFGYRWSADGSDKSGATGSTYTPADDDAGKAIRVPGELYRRRGQRGSAAQRADGHGGSSSQLTRHGSADDQRHGSGGRDPDGERRRHRGRRRADRRCLQLPVDKKRRQFGTRTSRTRRAPHTPSRRQMPREPSRYARPSPMTPATRSPSQAKQRSRYRRSGPARLRSEATLMAPARPATRSLMAAWGR